MVEEGGGRRQRIVVVVKTLVIEPIWKIESVLASTFVLRLSMPAVASDSLPLRHMAREIAGMLCSLISFSA